MSQNPTDSFLQSLVAGTQMMGQAGQNVLGQQQLGLQQAELAQRGRGMMQEERMQQRQLAAQQQMQLQEQQAQQQSYAQLNASRERMQTQELEAVRLRQQEQQAFMRQQAEMEQQMGLALQKVELELKRVDQEAMATTDDDPRLMELRQRYKGLKSKALKLKQTLGSGVMTASLAQADGAGVQAGGGQVVGTGLYGKYDLATRERDQRLKSVMAILQQNREGHDLEHGNAMGAVTDAFEVASMGAARDDSFLAQIERITDAGQLAELQTGGEGMGVATTPIGAGFRILLDEFQKSIVGSGDPDLMKTRTADFLQRGGVMVADTLHKAISMNGEKLGLEPGMRDAAATEAATMASRAAVLLGLDPRSRSIGMAQADELRRGIAESLGKLRQYGMSEAQLEGLLDGIDSIGANQAELLRAYTEREERSDQQVGLIEKALGESSRIHDVIDGIASDKDLMSPHGGPLQEPKKFNVEQVGRKAAMAYGAAGSPEMQELATMLQSLGIPKEEQLAMIEALTESVPELGNMMRPEDILAAIEAQASEAEAMNVEVGALEEDIRREQAQAVARRRSEGLGQAQSRIDQILAGLTGG